MSGGAVVGGAGAAHAPEAPEAPEAPASSATAASATAAPAEAPARDAEVAGEALTAPDTPWVTLVWNDPVNLMSYVAHVFRSYFGYPEDRAERLMRDVHEKGRAVVSTGSREQMERDVEAMHGYGLWATVRRDD